MTEYCSIIVTIYRHGEREEISKKCIRSLLENTTYPYELVVIDNTQNNRGLGSARNEGYSLSTGNFICFCDDDIDLPKFWLEECINLVQMGDKYLATPIIQRLIKKWELPRVNGYRHNSRTGSNCMVMRRSVIEEVGLFSTFNNKKYETAKTGKEFANRIFHHGYTFLITNDCRARDMGAGKHSYL